MGAGAAGNFFVVAAAVVAVTAAAVAAAAVAMGVQPQKVSFCLKHFEYGHSFKGVFYANTLYTCSRFYKFPKRGHLSERSTDKLKK